jgi:hypothetical protein
MRGLRSIAAILAGFGFLASTVMVGSIVAMALFIPGGLRGAAGGAVPSTIPAAYLAANLVVSAFGAVLGGWLAARIGTTAPFAHAVALAALVAAFSLASAIKGPEGPQPAWYPVAIGLICVAGVLTGGKVRAAAASAAA